MTSTQEKITVTRDELFAHLNTTVAQFIELYQHIPNPEAVQVDAWTAKNVLCHVTFWHESFARNVRDLVNDIPPRPLKGRYADLNQQCFAEMDPLPIETILQRFSNAQDTIRANVFNPKLTLIPYKKGSRDYTPEEHLYIVTEHVQDHLQTIKKIISRRKA
ncbi:MAG: hypothetical protein CVU39_21505 [Chloroflexi bacterium HGW-Chloroflexi-10]|nr:MAG: hypothetical protein CVU39_21505 [Chloroflexi bacterium HGW-Chloroflexi-10]